MTLEQPLLPKICIECGNDEVCQGYAYCSECVESAGIAPELILWLFDEDA